MYLIVQQRMSKYTKISFVDAPDKYSKQYQDLLTKAFTERTSDFTEMWAPKLLGTIQKVDWYKKR